MAVPSAPTALISGHKWGEDARAQVETQTADAATSVTAVISQTPGGAAIETVTTSTKAASYPRIEYWYLSWPTTGITSSPYYITIYATNSDGDGTPAEISTYIYFPPSVSVTSPANGSTLTDSSVTMAWTATDDYGISYQRASVSHDGTELWGAEVEGNSIAVPSSVVFENGESYSFSVTARNGKGMESTATSTASFSFVAPSVPELVIAEGDGKSASITVTDSSYTESGTVLEASSSMMESLTIQGQSVQDGTPTPGTPVAIESIEPRNLQPFFSKDFSDTSYWFFPPFTSGGTSTDTTPTATKLDDGWAHVEWSGTVSRRQLTATTPVMPTDGSIKPSSTYTLMVEVRNYSATGTNAQMIFPATDGTKAPWTTVSYQNVLSDGVFYYTASTKADISAATQLRCFMVACYGVSTSTTFALSFDIRISLYEGTYFGRYAPVGAIQVTSMSRNRFDDSVLLKVGNTNATVSDGTVTVSATSASGWSFAYASFPANEGETYTVSATVSGSSPRTLLAFNDATDAGTFLWSGHTYNTGSVSVTGTAPSGTNVVQVFLYARQASSGAVGDSATYAHVQLEIGSPATAYKPYSSTTTPIPVTLRSLPDGTHDEWVSGETEDTYIQRVGETMQAVTDGVTGTVGVDVLSSTGEIANGAQVLYKLATPVTTTLAHVSLPYVDGSAWVDAEVTPTIEATFRPVDFPDQPAADSVDVIRVNADGSTWTVASNLTMGDTAIDPLPPLGVDAVYKAVGKTSAGGMSEAESTFKITSNSWVFNFGNSAQETVELLYNPETTLVLDQGGASYHFADGGLGGGLPVFYPTTDRDMSGTLKFDTVVYGDADTAIDLCNRYPVAWLRDPYGHRWMARVRPSASHDYGGAWPVTISWSAVRFREAW